MRCNLTGRAIHRKKKEEQREEKFGDFSSQTVPEVTEIIASSKLRKSKDGSASSPSSRDLHILNFQVLSIAHLRPVYALD